MKYFSIIFLLVCLKICIPFSLPAQEVNEFDLYAVNFNIILPPLNVLIDSAIAHNSQVRFRDLDILIKSCKLKSDQNNWTRDFGVQTDIRYGTFDNFSTNTAEGQSPSIIATRNNQLNYGFGAYIKLPFYDFINRKNQVKLAKTEVEQAESMAASQRDELRLLVIRQYNDLVLKQRLLKIKSKYLETSRIDLEMIEKEYRNGVISISEYSRISGITSSSETDFETAKTDFITTYMILEEIVGFKFILKHTISKSNEDN